MFDTAGAPGLSLLHSFSSTFPCSAMPFYKCPEKYCGTDELLNLWVSVWPNSLNTPQSGAVRQKSTVVHFDHKRTILVVKNYRKVRSS